MNLTLTLDIQRDKKSTNFLLMHNLDPEVGKLSKETSNSAPTKRTLNRDNNKKKFAEDN